MIDDYQQINGYLETARMHAAYARSAATVEHKARVSDIEAIVGTRTHAARVYPIRRLRHRLDCSCGVTLGTALDYIDTKKAWRAHVG